MLSTEVYPEERRVGNVRKAACRNRVVWVESGEATQAGLFRKSLAAGMMEGCHIVRCADADAATKEIRRGGVTVVVATEGHESILDEARKYSLAILCYSTKGAQEDALQRSDIHGPFIQKSKAIVKCGSELLSAAMPSMGPELAVRSCRARMSVNHHRGSVEIGCRYGIPLQSDGMPCSAPFRRVYYATQLLNHSGMDVSEALITYPATVSPSQVLARNKANPRYEVDDGDIAHSHCTAESLSLYLNGYTSGMVVCLGKNYARVVPVVNGDHVHEAVVRVIRPQGNRYPKVAIDPSDRSVVVTGNDETYIVACAEGAQAVAEAVERSIELLPQRLRPLALSRLVIDGARVSSFSEDASELRSRIEALIWTSKPEPTANYWFVGDDAVDPLTCSLLDACVEEGKNVLESSCVLQSDAGTHADKACAFFGRFDVSAMEVVPYNDPSDPKVKPRQLRVTVRAKDAMSTAGYGDLPADVVRIVLSFLTPAERYCEDHAFLSTGEPCVQAIVGGSLLLSRIPPSTVMSDADSPPSTGLKALLTPLPVLTWGGSSVDD